MKLSAVGALIIHHSDKFETIKGGILDCDYHVRYCRVPVVLWCFNDMLVRVGSYPAFVAQPQ